MPYVIDIFFGHHLFFSVFIVLGTICYLVLVSALLLTYLVCIIWPVPYDGGTIYTRKYNTEINNAGDVAPP